MMWFRPVPALLLGVLLCVAAVCANDDRKVAVALVDVKFDDKAAIWSLLLDPQYKRVVAITTGIEKHGEATWELKQYLARQNQMARVKFDPSKIEIFRGTNPLPKVPPHEVWWNENPKESTYEATEERLRAELHGNKVRVFQIAPTHPDIVQRIINAADPGSIDTYMLLHGYNSRQFNAEWMTYFMRNLRRWVRERNPRAEVYFTSSFASYEAMNGGKQPLAALEHVFPKYDIDQAVKDPFWSEQLLRVYNQGLMDRPFPAANRKELDNIILAARTRPEENEAWRAYIRDYINEVLARHPPELHKSNAALSRLKYTHLPEFTGTRPLTLELADAAHVAAFHRYMAGKERGRNTGMYTTPVEYPAGQHSDNSKVEFVPADESSMSGLLLKGADRDADLLHIKGLAGLAHF